MKKTFILILLIMLATGCQGLKKGLGLEKDVPDEFLIEKIDPIERPPNYDLLPPGSKIKTAKRKSNKNLKNIIDGDLKKNNSLCFQCSRICNNRFNCKFNSWSVASL